MVPPVLCAIGDPYRTGWRGKQPVHLTAGWHTLWVPFTTTSSTAQFTCTIAEYTDPAENPLALVTRGEDGGLGGRPFLFSDIVDGVLATPIGSIVVENRGLEPITEFKVLPLMSAGGRSPPFTVSVAPDETSTSRAN
eukprot:SAG31_NODE_137_length_23063_cov_5.002569_11_plen_137_part_00